MRVCSFIFIHYRNEWNPVADLDLYIYYMYTEKSKSEKIKLANTLYGPLRLSRFEVMFVTWQNRTQGRRSPLILYQLTLPDPLFVSSLLSAGDASQNTIPLGECLRHLVGLSVCVWEWLSCWFVCDSLQGKWPSGVFKSWLSPFYVQLLWYMMQDIILSRWHLFLRMCASVGLSPSSAHNNSGTQDEPLKLSAHRVQVTPMWLFEHLMITLNNSLICITGYVLYIMRIMGDH